jgi:L-ascorbate metabolism protein UlaG (beta-lactamase superfamily)
MKMPKLLYQGHGSFRITAGDGRVIYVDPYAGEGYDLPADIILVSHQHRDHNCIDLCKQKQDCTIISNAESLAGGKLNCFDIDGIKVQAVEAYNKNHKPEECVGFIITVDGVKIYACGDTSKTKQMETFAEIKLDYAFFCGDGVYNMNPEEAAECAEIIGAKNNIIIHLTPGQLFDRPKAEAWTAPNKLIVCDGEEIELLKS